MVCRGGGGGGGDGGEGEAGSLLPPAHPHCDGQACPRPGQSVNQSVSQSVRLVADCGVEGSVC